MIKGKKKGKEKRVRMKLDGLYDEKVIGMKTIYT